ncbi:hypothetical protein KPL71_023838 [Citrus sinensis]|uniref:Uncharacterized protein n=1 Tax=Citrus sinensis TaxID=2711 RepID=A0ACB8INV2_CITSI|nr:hypothetical protein KPL71_023838 [Citrus sinensis]
MHLHLGSVRLILTLHGRKSLPVTARIALLDTSAQNQTLQQLGKKIDRVASQVSQTETKVDSISNRLDQMYIHLQDRISELDADLRGMINNHIWETVYKSNPSESNPSSSSSSTNSVGTSTDSESEYADITSILMATKTEYPSTSTTTTPIVEDSSSDAENKASPTESEPSMPPPVPDHSTKPSSASWFTFDDIPRHKWPAQLQEFTAWIDLQGTKPNAQPQVVLREFMARSTSSLRDCFGVRYKQMFLPYTDTVRLPPLEPHTDSHRNVMSKPFIPSPITSTGHLEPPKPFESVLNWQTQNARAQNDTLLNINSKVENISLRTEQLETKVDSISAQMQQIHQNLQSRITQLDSKLRAMLAQRYYGPEFDQKEREIRRLKAELAQIESDKQRPTLFTTSPPIPSIDNPLPPPPKPKPKLRPQPRPVTFHIPGQHSPGHTPASPPVPSPPTESQPPSQSKDKQPMHQFSAHTVDHSSTTDDQTSDSNLAVFDSHTETDTESSVSTSDSEKSYADITRILMAQPDQPPPSQTSHTEPYVDIPSEVEEEMPESSATNQMLRLGATTQSVLREFATRFTEVSSALAVIHDQFLGDPSAVFEAARRDYLNMKCCSLNATDLDFHYKRMSLLFYKLNGFNEPTLKHVFQASLPDELQPDIQRQLTASNLSLDNISLGKIFQLAKTCLDKLCEQKQFFKELLKDKEPFRSACKKPYLQIKCKQKKDCDCSPKKKRHFKKFRNPEFSSRPRRSRKPYRFFRKKSSSSIDFKPRKSSRCFICKKKGHFAKDCPHKREKSIRLVEHLQATTDYSPKKDELEFYFSEQDEPNDETVFALQNSSDDSDSDQSQIIFHQQLLSLDTTIPIPSIKLQILPSKFQRPIPAIGLIDTGAQRSMLNPHLLPPEYWTDYEEHFKAVNGKLFTTSLITKKPIGSHDEHRQLLTQFYEIVHSHGIMLSAKKSTIATDNIEFLGMIIKDGHYQPGTHIAQELLHFPDQHFSKRQVQQFFGIITTLITFRLY